MSRPSSSIAVRRSSRGLSLIEIMVSLAIAALLLLGLSQIFIGSKAAYITQDGMSRTQESARFVMDTLEKNIRMVDFSGCGNKSDAAMQFLNHTITYGAPTVTSSKRFNRPIEGFEYSGPTTDNKQPIQGAAADWTPALPSEPADFTQEPGALPIQGSDVLILRVLSAESTPAMGVFNPTSGAFQVAPVAGDPDFVKVGNLYGLTSCRPRIDIFKASATSGGAAPGGLLTMVAATADNPLLLPSGADTTTTWGWNGAQLDFTQPPAGSPPDTLNAEVHRADYLAFYVGLRSPPPDDTPILKIQHFVGGSPQSEELVEGVESMQITYGMDTNGDGIADPGDYVDAKHVLNGATTEADMDARWRSVVSVRIGLLMRGEATGAAPRTGAVVPYDVNGVILNRPDDARFRDVYVTTIAVRNRLVNY